MDIRSLQDWLVGGISMLMGAALCFGALAESTLRDRLKITRLVAEKFGQTAARALCVIVGLLLIALGIAIACGYSLELIGKNPRRANYGNLPA